MNIWICILIGVFLGLIWDISLELGRIRKIMTKWDDATTFKKSITAYNVRLTRSGNEGPEVGK